MQRLFWNAVGASVYIGMENFEKLYAFHSPPSLRSPRSSGRSSFLLCSFDADLVATGKRSFARVPTHVGIGEDGDVARRRAVRDRGVNRIGASGEAGWFEDRRKTPAGPCVCRSAAARRASSSAPRFGGTAACGNDNRPSFFFICCYKHRGFVYNWTGRGPSIKLEFRD